MHKKVIGGSAYYYVTNRDSDGRHRTYNQGKDFEIAKTREREILGKHSRPSFKINSQKLLYLPLMILCGLGLFFLSGQVTGSFIYEPATVEFGINESWNLSETLLRVSLGEYTEDIPAMELIAGDKISLSIPDLSLNSSGRAYIDLIVSGELIDSEYVDVAEEAADLEILKAEVEKTLGIDDNVNVASVEKEGKDYKITVDLNTEGKGAVILWVGNVSDARRIQTARLGENTIQL